MKTIMDFRSVPTPRMKQISDTFKQIQSDMIAIQNKIWEATEWQRKMLLDALAPIQELINNAQPIIAAGLDHIQQAGNTFTRDQSGKRLSIYSLSVYPDRSGCSDIHEQYRGPNLVKVCCRVTKDRVGVVSMPRTSREIPTSPAPWFRENKQGLGKKGWLSRRT